MQPKKHKNGRIVKDEYGHTVFEHCWSKSKARQFYRE